MNAGFQDLLQGLAASRRVFPHQYNLISDQGLLVEISPEAQDQASFLDERVLPQGARGAWFAFADIARATPAGRSPPGYIFHMGHCGSTLISRLVSKASGTNGVREPLPLRVFAADLSAGPGALLSPETMTDRLAIFEALWARNPAVVKATSICTGLAGNVQLRGRPAVFLFQKPETHLAVLLAGANAGADLRGFAQLRHKRLASRFDIAPLAGASPGALAAMTWMAEAADAHAAGLPAFDFDGFLKAPEACLAEICGALALTAPPEKITGAIASDIMQRYSKAPDHEYSAGLRDQIIAQSRQNNAAEIAEGKAWLEAFRKQNSDADAVYAHME